MNDNQDTNENKKQGKRLPNIPKKPQKGSKFNIFWVYAAIIVAIVAAQFLFTSDGGKEVKYETFENQMLLKGDVDRIVAYQTEDLVKAEVYIKKDSLNKAQYKAFKSTSSFNVSSGPTVFFKIGGKFSDLRAQLAESQKDLPLGRKPISFEPENRSNPLASWFLSIILPVLLLIGFWIFMMRRMGGGAGGGGQIFSIGKSKATLFDKESQVSTTLEGDFGFTRLLYNFSLRRYDEFEKKFRNKDRLKTEKETWRLNAEINYAVNDLPGKKIIDVKKRLNAELSFNYSFPFMNNVFLMASAGYYGEDPYNIYFKDHYGYLRFGFPASS